MKKEEKIIKIRTAVKNQVAETRAYFAALDADAMERRAKELTELTNASDNERKNCIARFQAVFADNRANMLKRIALIYAESEKACQEAVDDPEPEQKPKPEHDQPQTVYIDGSEHSTRIVARRLINKLPHIPEGGAITVMISHGDESLSGKYWLSVTTNNGGKWPENICSIMFDENNHEQDSETSFVDEVRASFDARKEGGDE